MHRFMFTLGLLAAWPVAALIQPPPVDAMTSLPVAELKAIEADGEVFFMSANGRFVFRGQLTDAWHRQPLDSLAAIRHASTHIDLDAMGVPLDALNTLTVGEGPRRVVVFVDPRCGYCKRFMAAAQPQAQRYTFKFVVAALDTSPFYIGVHYLKRYLQIDPMREHDLHDNDPPE